MKKQQQKSLGSHKIFPEEVLAIRESFKGDLYKIMIVNTALKNYQYKDKFTWSLFFNIDIKYQDKNGLPTKEEADILNLIEDQIQILLHANCKYQFIGRITHEGNRDIYYYIDDPENIHDALQLHIDKNLFRRELEYVIEEDEHWSFSDIFFNYDNG